MKRIITIGLVALMPLLAHHSIPAEYDITKMVTFKGTVTNLEWMNPHVNIYVDVVESDGKVTKWKFETLPPNTLKRLFGKDFIKQGDQIIVNAWVAKDLSQLANIRTMTLPDGRTVSMGDGWGMEKRQ